MKLSRVMIPVGVVLAIGGAIMVFASVRTGRKGPLYPDTLDVSTLRPEFKHPVDQGGLKAAGLLAGTSAPHFLRKDVHGIDLEIGGATGRPQFVYFIMEGCPCSLNSQPGFNKLYQKYKDSVSFIGVMNADKAKALDYAGMTTTLNPIVSDVKLEINKAFKARESTYNALVDGHGKIVKMWPGYSQATLRDADRLIRGLTGDTRTALDVHLAPVDMASGCYYW